MNIPLIANCDNIIECILLLAHTPYDCFTHTTNDGITINSVMWNGTLLEVVAESCFI